MRAIACMMLLISACSSQSLRCDQHLKPINTAARTGAVDTTPAIALPQSR